MPYDLLVYKKTNWKLDPVRQSNELFRIANNPRSTNVDKDLNLFQDKISNCPTYGDICRVLPGGTLTDVMAVNQPYWGILVTTGDYETAKQYAFPLYREFQYERTLNNTTEHIYEYRIWVETAINNFRPGEYVHLPVDASVINKSVTEINIRLLPLTHPRVISGEITALERRNDFQSRAREELHNLERFLLRCKYRIDLDSVPSGIMSQLQLVGKVSVTQAQLLPYLQDKSL